MAVSDDPPVQVNLNLPVMLRLFVSLGFLILSAVPLGASKSIRVDSQEAFEALNESLLSCMQEEQEEIQVVFEQGTYFYSDRQLCWEGLDYPGLRIVVDGGGSLFVPKGKDFSIGPMEKGQEYDKPFSTDDGFVSLAREETVDFRDAVKACKTIVLPAFWKKRLFCFRCAEPDLSEEEARDTYILLTQWYTGAVYKVKHIRNGWLFFYAEKKKYSTRWYEEFRYGRCRPRYCIYNQRSGEHPYVLAGKLCGPEEQSIHRCEASNFLYMSDCRFRQVVLQNGRFLGNRAGGYLLHFQGGRSQEILVQGCHFQGIRSHVVLAADTENFHFCDNSMDGCFLQGVRIDPASRNSRICRNVFRNHGQMLSTSPAVYCQGSGFLVEWNTFENFAYCAIGLGTHYVETDRPYTSGIVQHNEIYQTESFRKPPMNALIDSGAIYVWTQNVSTIIRYNYIHDISGPHGNRAILCDDGVIYTSIHDNLIIGIDHNSYCIDLRKRQRIERRASCQIPLVNIGNKMWGNWVDGRVRFHVRKGDGDACEGNNRILGKDYDRDAVYTEWKKTYDYR